MRISANMASNFVYTAAAMSVFPNAVHITYLIMRFVYVSSCLFSDSTRAYNRLRYTPEKFVAAYGGSGKRGIMTFVFAILGSFGMLTDVFRHYLVLFLTDNVTLISFDIVNPFNGNRFQLTNVQLMDVSYFTAMVFVVQAIYTSSNTKTLKTTSQAKFVFME